MTDLAAEDRKAFAYLHRINKGFHADDLAIRKRKVITALCEQFAFLIVDFP